MRIQEGLREALARLPATAGRGALTPECAAEDVSVPAIQVAMGQTSCHGDHAQLRLGHVIVCRDTPFEMRLQTLPLRLTFFRIMPTIPAYWLFLHRHRGVVSLGNVKRILGNGSDQLFRAQRTHVAVLWMGHDRHGSQRLVSRQRHLLIGTPFRSVRDTPFDYLRVRIHPLPRRVISVATADDLRHHG